MNKALLTAIAIGLFLYGLYELTFGSSAILGLFAWFILISVCVAGAAMHSPVVEVAGYSRSAAKAQSATHYTSAEWVALCEQYGWRCLCCGKQRKLTADHVTPLYLGGSDDISNIQPLCAPCNSKKGARFIDYRTTSSL